MAEGIRELLSYLHVVTEVLPLWSTYIVAFVLNYFCCLMSGNVLNVGTLSQSGSWKVTGTGIKKIIWVCPMWSIDWLCDLAPVAYVLSIFVSLSVTWG